VFTKFDQVVTIEDRNSARIEARAWYEQSCRPLFRRKARDVPAEIVSGSSFLFCGMALDDLLFSVKSQFNDLIDNLVVTTDKFIIGSRTASNPSARSNTQGAKPRIAPIPLVWSAAVRVHQDIFIQASIEYVAFLQSLISFIYLVSRVGRSREYNHLSD